MRPQKREQIFEPERKGEREIGGRRKSGSERQK